jgi:GTP cyclohydrolase I
MLDIHKRLEGFEGLHLNGVNGYAEPQLTDEERKIEDAVRTILQTYGEDPEREGLLSTPKRVRKMYAELLAGYNTDPVKLINGAVFTEKYDEMVIVRGIEYYSLCEHHMLPFIGHAHVAYIPNNQIIGLSKIPRIVDMFSRRLQVQERLTNQIADFLMKVLEPQGVAVVLDGVHMCSMLRGVMKHDSSMTTSAMRGVFRNDAKTRSEFMEHLARASESTL